MVRSGNYEVDDEGNLIEVAADGAADTLSLDRATAPTDTDADTPPQVRKALRSYDFGRYLAFVALVAVALAQPEVRRLLLILAVLYLLASFAVRRIYRRALIRGTEDRS